MILAKWWLYYWLGVVCLHYVNMLPSHVRWRWILAELNQNMSPALFTAITTGDVLIRSHDQKSMPIMWFQTRWESDITSLSGIGYIYIYIYMYIYSHHLFIRSMIFQNKWEKCVWARHESGIDKHNDRPPLSTFFCASDSWLHVTKQVANSFITIERWVTG